MAPKVKAPPPVVLEQNWFTSRFGFTPAFLRCCFAIPVRQPGETQSLPTEFGPAGRPLPEPPERVANAFGPGVTVKAPPTHQTPGETRTV